MRWFIVEIVAIADTPIQGDNIIDTSKIRVENSLTMPMVNTTLFPYILVEHSYILYTTPKY